MSLKKKKPAAKTKAEDLMVKGFRASGVSCGIKKGRKKDLALILSDLPCSVAGLFTRNRVKAAPVQLDIRRIKSGTSRGVVINSGNANACTGKRGLEDSGAVAASIEKILGVRKGHILVSSTGVIGLPLPVQKIKARIPALVKGLKTGGFRDAAYAIMTTDAFPKSCLTRARINGKTTTVLGIAKGAGMICPDMATMLAFFMTDANIKSSLLKKALKEAVDPTFNSITVDNDTSTNDTVLIFANSANGSAPIQASSPGFKTFKRLLFDVSSKLARMIVSDGEGATKVIEIEIKGASSGRDAEAASRTLAGSFLVKTAFFGGDPNWGRIMAALGRAGIRMREDRVGISFNGIPVVKGGIGTSCDLQASRALKSREITVTVTLNMGRACHTLLTTDLSIDYVKLNSAYKT